MSSFKIRPRFQQQFGKEPDELIAIFKQELERTAQKPCSMQISGRYIVLQIPTREQHYWSPQLSLSIEETEKGSLIRGLYGPKPSVWTLFTFGYFALATAFTITGIAAYSYHLLNIPSRLFWLLPVYLVAAITLYVIAQFGQKLGAQQTFTIHHYYEGLVGKHAVIE